MENCFKIWDNHYLGDYYLVHVKFIEGRSIEVKLTEYFLKYRHYTREIGLWYLNLKCNKNERKWEPSAFINKMNYEVVLKFISKSPPNIPEYLEWIEKIRSNNNECVGKNL